MLYWFCWINVVANVTAAVTVILIVCCCYSFRTVLHVLFIFIIFFLVFYSFWTKHSTVLAIKHAAQLALLVAATINLATFLDILRHFLPSSYHFATQHKHMTLEKKGKKGKWLFFFYFHGQPWIPVLFPPAPNIKDFTFQNFFCLFFIYLKKPLLM